MSIFKKLTYIQHEISVPKSQWNDFSKFHYRSVEDIQMALKPLLIENDLTLTLHDEMHILGDRVYVKATATLYDFDGNCITTKASAREALTKKGMDDSQITGTATSYARKYALGGMFLLDDEQDADAKDNSQSNSSTSKGSQATQKTAEKGWYNDFDKDRADLLKRVEGGAAPEMLLKSAQEKFKVNKEVQQKFLDLGK